MSPLHPACLKSEEYVVLIPARSGSKRLASKNKLPLKGLPLIGWTIKTALLLFSAEQIIISTDDPTIKSLVSGWGLCCKSLRPPHLSSDDASLFDVAKYELIERASRGYKIPKHIVLLQPTSPLRLPSSIRRATEQYYRGGHRQVVGCTRTVLNRKFVRTVSGESSFNSLDCNSPNAKDQYLAITGFIYISQVSDLLNARTFTPQAFLPFIPDYEFENLDIDTAKDFFAAERELERIFRNKADWESSLDVHSAWLTLVK
jgi:CMP-N-acetylneuraminic acid synthetase